MPTPEAVIDLSIAVPHVREALDVMPRSFAEYSLKGEPAGVMLETVESLHAEMAGGRRIAVGRVDGRIVAAAKHYEASDGSWYFGRLAVLPEARGRGLAAALVRALRVEARARGLAGLSCTVRAGEPGNIAIYEHLGMRVVTRGERRSLTGAIMPVVDMADAPA